MAEVTLQVEDSAIIQMLESHHGLRAGDGRIDQVELGDHRAIPADGPSEMRVSVTMSFMLSSMEMSELTGFQGML